MTTFKQKTSDILKNHLTAFIDYKGASQELLKEAVLNSKKWREEVLKEEVNGQLNLMREQFQAKEVMFNNELQLVVEEVKSKLGLDIEIKKPVDYAAKVTNANEYLKMEGQEITDDQAYLILKEFVDDMDQMQLFKRLMEKMDVEFTNANGNSNFPNTFGKLNKHLVVFNAVNEFESLAENAFLNSTELSGETYRFYNTTYHAPMQSYDARVNPSILIALADTIDKFIEASEVPSISKV